MIFRIPEVGSKRERLKFFWRPIRVHNTLYWLEVRMVREEYWRRSDGFPTLPFCNNCQWMIVEVL